MALNPAALGVAAVVATAGLWWFTTMLKESRAWPANVRYGVYAGVWLAYFGLTAILTHWGARG